MTDFQRLLRYIRNSEIVVHQTDDRGGRGRDVVAVIANSEIRVNPRDAALLSAFRPTFYVSAGERAAKLDKVEASQVSGRTVGYFSIVCRNPRTGQRERYAWRYGVRNGAVVLEHTFPVTAR